MKDTKKGIAEQSEMGLSLEELIRRAARELIQKAIEVEVQELLAEYGNVKMLGGQRAVVRNGYLPAREVLTAIGNVEVRVPKVRDRSGGGIKFNSALVPPFVRRSQRVSAALPWLYLKGISTGDMREALTVLLGDEAKGLSANVVSRLKSEWATEYSGWMKRDLSASRYVYWWVDGIHTGLRQENDARQCLLVIIGVTPEGKKELVTIGDGLRESKESWLDVLRDLAARGLGAGPLLAVGDGALGFWAALDEVFPDTRRQRCWVHKTANILNALPKSLQAKAKADLHEIWMAPTRPQAIAAFDHFLKTYGAKYPKATDKTMPVRLVPIREQTRERLPGRRGYHRGPGSNQAWIDGRAYFRRYIAGEPIEQAVELVVDDDHRPMLLPDESLRRRMVQPCHQQIEVVLEIEQSARLAVESELCPCQYLRNLVQSSQPAGQRDEGIGELDHHRFPLMHGADDSQFGQEAGRRLEAKQGLGDDADHFPSGIKRTAGDGAHESEPTTAIDDADPRLRQARAHGPGRYDVGRRRARIGTAENTGSSHPHSIFP